MNFLFLRSISLWNSISPVDAGGDDFSVRVLSEEDQRKLYEGGENALEIYKQKKAEKASKKARQKATEEAKEEEKEKEKKNEGN